MPHLWRFLARANPSARFFSLRSVCHWQQFCKVDTRSFICRDTVLLDFIEQLSAYVVTLCISSYSVLPDLTQRWLGRDFCRWALRTCVSIGDVSYENWGTSDVSPFSFCPVLDLEQPRYLTLDVDTGASCRCFRWFDTGNKFMFKSLSTSNQLRGYILLCRLVKALNFRRRKDHSSTQL